jgi:hypothetical protein
LARLGWRLKLYCLTAPGTTAYCFTLIVTTFTLRAASAGVARRLLVEQSTNLHNLRAYPLEVLFTSAFWSSSEWLLPTLVPFVIFLAPAERWLGTGRWAAIFALGHVGATLLTAIMLWFVTDHGHTHPELLRAVDVGASYGCYAVAGALIWRLPRGWRAPCAGALALYLLSMLLFRQTFTDFGHVCALLLGLLCYVGVRGRMSRAEHGWAPDDAWLLATGADRHGRTTLDWSLPRLTPPADAA